MMMMVIGERERDIYDAICDSHDLTGFTPKASDLADLADCSLQECFDALRQLRGLGLIRWESDGYRTILEPVRVSWPMLGTVSGDSEIRFFDG